LAEYGVLLKEKRLFFRDSFSLIVPHQKLGEFHRVELGRRELEAEGDLA
jgi:hypothetical protein